MQTFRKAPDTRKVARLGRFWQRRSWLCVGLGGLLVGSLALPQIAMCDSERWRSLHDEVAAGRVISLSQLLDGLERDWLGQVVEVELDESHGELIYEVEMLGPEGQMAKFTVRATDGSLREVRGINLDAMRRHAHGTLSNDDDSLGNESAGSP
ncbi:PepSY domain-containing protein [Cobetia sp. L2A1]|uniref:PepSY domain-containing protein n=1 Tax=Cobetia sp. L2A1 TaxID=2686360 RepID=UPI00131DCCE0|nr:peptidase [Cobetia sp. L2A1]